ncbi:hypothetical protein K505DRAFT_340046 [Melanomma pulvis-pyrius CBS 109.77]|uniref:Uncharacterized protein n=1 Tax=Melanomma pulvis-pyrius CBS 109.77 TaxID=1314802 RepID=A0A6A6X3E3_9PLEO|nr:hypothetical protein K505DRAFT_340046 [Melanomma pulvis-pyrius CBS 109.77]
MAHFPIKGMGCLEQNIILDEGKTLYAAQKMRISGDVVKINVFGLIFIISFSVLVSLVDNTLLKMLIFASRSRRALASRIERWVQDGVWQLQRRAYEGQGQGYRGWIDVEKDFQRRWIKGCW